MGLHVKKSPEDSSSAIAKQCGRALESGPPHCCFHHLGPRSLVPESPLTSAGHYRWFYTLAPPGAYGGAVEAFGLCSGLWLLRCSDVALISQLGDVRAWLVTWPGSARSGAPCWELHVSSGEQGASATRGSWGRPQPCHGLGVPGKDPAAGCQQGTASPLQCRLSEIGPDALTAVLQTRGRAGGWGSCERSMPSWQDYAQSTTSGSPGCCPESRALA